MTVIRFRWKDARQWACPAAAMLLDAWEKAGKQNVILLLIEDEFGDHIERCSECRVNVRSYWARHRRPNPAAGN